MKKMINLLIPSMGKSLFFKDSYFPKPMIEVAGKTMLEQIVDNYSTLTHKKFIFIFDQRDCREFHLDESARVLTGEETGILILENQTKGALCTCLMAVKMIDNDEPLLIANCDQIIDIDYIAVMEKFDAENDEAGIVTFDSIHPRWSYAKISGSEVIEVAEKRPLSKHAIAGFYYFRRGKDFVEAAKKVILKDNAYNGQYYISSSLNQMILLGKRVGYFPVTRNKYHSFYSPDKIRDYERHISLYQTIGRKEQKNEDFKD